jgi:hypothetical protein
MMVIEMREAAREKAFDLVEELHELGHEKKVVLCELEDTLYDCFEKEDEEREFSEEGTDLGFKSKNSRSHGMRNFEDASDEPYAIRRRSMRMRRNRMYR